jgi:hypothetical protein
MKKRLINFSALVMILISLSFSNKKTLSSENINNIKIDMQRDGTIVKNDFKESILSFANEERPVDSLYMPEWINSEED